MISTFTSTQIAALFGTAILTVLPATMFAGMLVPTSSITGMGAVLGRLFPMTYFLPISVGTFTKGLGFADLSGQLLILAAFVPALTLLSLVLLRRQEKYGMRTLSTIFWLATKELRSLFQDWVLLGLVVYSFSLAIIAQAQGNTQELHNASIGIVDEDHSELSRRIARAFLPPYFKPAEKVEEHDIDHLMNIGKYTFIVDIPPHFQRDVVGGRNPSVQVAVDATAVMQAGIGSGYAQQIISTEIGNFASHAARAPLPPVNLAVRIAFNPNVTTAWFTSIMGIINSVTMLAIILAGAAVVREREHGTMDHLLVMPISPFEIAMSKILANSLVITVAVGLSLYIVVRQLLGIPIAGSVPLFMLGVVLYLFFATSIGIFLATIARTMPQLGLLFLLVAVPLNMLSGSNTPLESMPPFLRTLMQASPSTHFVSFAQAILYRGAGFDVVWREYAAVAAIGMLFLGLGLLRFRRVATQAS